MSRSIRPFPYPSPLLMPMLMLMLSALSGLSSNLQAADKPSITVYMYSEYIDPDIPKQFEKLTGIAVTIDVYEAQEEMIAKLRAGGSSQYDVVVASDVVIQPMIALKLVKPLDAAKIPNAVNIDKRFRDPAYDKGNLYSWPYQWGTIGLMYRKDAVPAGPLSWALIFDPAKQPGHVLMIDEMRTQLGLALMFLGKPASSRVPDDLKRAGELLVAAKHGEKCLGFDGGVGGRNRVMAGEAAIAVVYNGDAVKAMAEDRNVAFAVPVEGTLIAMDNLLVCAKAPNPDGAHAFINYILDAKVGAQLSNFNRYATPNAASMPFIAKDDAEDPAIYPTDAEMRKMSTLEDVGADARLYDQVWTSVKSR